MTAYNDEASIGDAVCDFKNRTGVSRVVVIDNNSIDATALRARESGALVVSEPVQGYGAACICALRQGLLTECDIVCLVEGDGTFSGVDLAKLVAYASNADMVLGTRTTKELTSPDSQMNWLMRLGNVFMAKLLQVRFWHVRLTDMGCTYRLIRQNALRRMIDKLSITGNEFLCEMTLTALRENLKTIEIPVSLRKRVGISKGVGGNIPKAVAVGLKMWKLILFR
jgi:glycosyltransferase involved in cell wall biosynthesis